MCISNIGNRRPFPTNGFKSRGGMAIEASTFKTDTLKNISSSSVGSCKNHHIVVQHCYHDHAYDNRTDYQEHQPARGGVTVPFPLKLHEMLNSVVENGHEQIVSWQPHGRCFVVHKLKEFTKLLPHYFKLSKLASFQRQLNLYGFQRLTRGSDRGGYYHELFLKDRVFLAHSIQRIKVKGTGVRARSNPDQEPDFWAMPWVQPQQSDNDNSGYAAAQVVSCEASTHSFGRSTSVSPKPFAMTSDESSQSDYFKNASNGARSVLSGDFFSQMLPLHLEPTALPPLLSMDSGSNPLLLEDDELFGKHFFHVEKSGIQKPVAVPPSPPPSSSLNSIFDTFESQNDVQSNDFEEFFEDFDFPDEIGEEIEDDQVFGALLEQMIA